MNIEDNEYIYKEGEEIGSTLAGLIPSSSFQRDRENRKKLYMGDSTLVNGKRPKDIFGKKDPNTEIKISYL